VAFKRVPKADTWLVYSVSSLLDAILFTDTSFNLFDVPTGTSRIDTPFSLNIFTVTPRAT